MALRASSLQATNTLAINREIDSKYDAVLAVRDKLVDIEKVADINIEQLLADLQEAQDFTGISVVVGDVAGWNAVTKTITVPTVKGDTGAQGVQGEQGERGLQGDTGPRGLTGAAGANGRDGINGRDGVDGINGIDGIDGNDLTVDQIVYNNDGTFTWMFSDGTSYETPDLRGPKGDVGEQGVKGDQGISVHHIKGTSTTNALGDFATYGDIDTYTVYGDAAETINLGYFRVNNGLAKDGQTNIMFGSTYDTTNNGVVDNSERLNGKTLHEVQDFASIHSKPTTLSGYGINDAFTKAEVTTNINNAVAELVNGAPAILDTLSELSTALDNDANFATTVANSIGDKVTKNSAIVAGTNTQITYDSKGLVTGGTTPTTLAGYSINDAYTKTEGDARYESKNVNIQNHIANTSNPHGVTKTQVGLGNVDNTTDANKNVLSATKWTTARTLSLTGDVTGSSSIDGSANANITMTLANSGVTAGTYSNVTVDGKGRVTAATNPTTIAGFGITDAYTKTEVLGSFGRLSSPLLDLPLKNSLSMKAGVGSTTFTRASTATYIDRYGVLKTVGIDEPRFENDGLLIEESSNNLLTYSDNMLIGYIYKRVTPTLSTTELSPDGITYASELRETTETGGSYVYKSFTFTAGTTYTHSVFAKSINGQNLTLYSFTTSTGFDKTYSVIFDLTNGTISGSGASNAKIVPLPNGWYRCSITATCTTTTTSNTTLIYMSAEYSSPDYGLYIFGSQLEEKPFASSYIPTTDSAVTRAITGSSITAYGNAPSKDEGTIYCKFKLLSHHNSTNCIWSLYATGTNNIRCYVTIDGFLLIRSGSSSGGLIKGSTPFTLNKNQEYSVCATWKDNLLKVYIDGVLAYEQSWSGDLFGTNLPVLSNFSIGKYATNYTTLIGNGNYKSFKTYDKALTPTEIALLG